MIIFFDIDDTLFPSSEFSGLARKNAINAMIGMGLDYDQKMLDTKLTKIIREKGSNYQNHFDILCKELKIKQPARYVAAAIAAYHDTKTAIQPFPRVSLTLLELKQEGHRLFVATNGTSIKQWDKLIRLHVAQYFDDVFVSQDMGREKDVLFFEKVLKKTGQKSDNCVMVGDKEESDIIPPKTLGIHTIRVLQGKYAKIPTKAEYKISEFSEILGIIQKIQ